MSTTLVIAGHGRNKDGSFDPGAKGLISKGEHKYYVENFFPAVRKYLPAGHKVVLFSVYNVYDRENLASLAKSYGSDTIVVEMHYDAATELASGGHVIIHEDYEPDSYDLKLAALIKKHIGVRYSHRGHVGISGRSDLRNCNMARASGINYRLVELGFGTNKKDADIMVNKVDAIAKDFVQAICGTTANDPVATKPAVSGAKVHKVVKGDTLWGISKKYGVTVANLKAWNSLKSDLIVPGQTLNLQATVAKPVAKKLYVHLPANNATWRAYPLHLPPVKGNEVGFLAPAQFQPKGIHYEVLNRPSNNVVTVKTGVFGKVNIYVGPDTNARLYFAE